MEFEKENLLIQHDIDNISVFTTNVVKFTDRITNNGTKDKEGIVLKAYLTENYSFIEESIEINGVSSLGNIIDGITIDSLKSGKSLVVVYYARAEHRYAGINTYVNLTCDYIDDEKVESIYKDSNTVDSSIYDKRLGIKISYEKQDCKVNDTNTFTVKLYNYDKTQFYYNASLKNVLSDKYKFIDGSIKINNEKYNGTIENIHIESLESNTWTTIVFDAKATEKGEAILNSNIEYYYKDTEQNEIKEEETAEYVLTNIFEDDNDNVKAELSISPIITNISYSPTFILNVTNNGDKKLENIFVKVPINPNYLMNNGSLTVNDVPTSGNISDGITIDMIDTKATTKIEFIGIPENYIENEEINATISYNYEKNDEKVIGTKSSNSVFYTIIPNNDGLFFWNITSDKEEYVVGEKINFTIEAINVSDHVITEAKIYSKLPSGVSVIKGTTKINEKAAKDITEVLDIMDAWNINEKIVITFCAVATSVKEDMGAYAGMSYFFVDDLGNNVFNMTQTNKTSFDIKEKEKVEVSLDLTVKEGYIVKPNDSINFVATIKNENDYNRELKNLFFTPSMPSEFFLLDENSVKQDDEVLQKSEDGKYILNNILPNATSVITYTAKALKITTAEKETGATLQYTYENQNNADIEKTIYDSYSIFVVNSDEGKFNFVKQVNYNTCEVGTEIHYRIIFLNNDEKDINYVFVKDLIDETVDFVEGSVLIDNVSQPSLSIINGINIGPVKVDNSKDIEFKGIAKKKGTNNNVAYAIASYDTPTEDSEIFGKTSNTTSTKITQTTSASYTVTKTSNKNSYFVDDEASFEIKIINTGNVDIKNIMLSDVLAGQLEYVDNTLKLDGFKLEDKITNVNIGLLKVGNTKSLTFFVKCLTEGENIKNSVTTTAKYINDDGVETDLPNTSNELSLNVLSSLINVEFKLFMEEKIVEVDNKAKFIATIYNDNNHEISISNINFSKILDSDYYTFNQGSVKQDNIVVPGNEINGYTLNSVAAGTTSKVTFSATAIKIGDDISNESNITYEYKDLNDTVHQAILSSSYDSYNVIDSEDVFDITKKVEKTRVAIGKTVHFVINYTNNYEGKTSTVLFKDDIDENLQYITGTTKIDGVVTTDIIDGVTKTGVEPGKTHVIEFDCTTLKAGRYINKAYAFETIDGTNEKYGKYSNDIAIIVEEEEQCDFYLTKKSDKSVYVKDDIAHFIITANSIATIPVNNLVIKDVLVSQFEFVEDSITIDGTKYTGTPDTITVGNWNTDILTIEFDAKCIEVGTRVANTANASFSYVKGGTTYTGNRICNTIYADILADDSVIVNFKLTMDDNMSYVGDTVTFKAIIENESEYDVPIYDVLFSKELNSDYFTFDTGSVKQDGTPVTGDDTTGYTLNDIAANTTSIVTFTAKAIKDYAALGLTTKATISYKYINKEAEEISATLTSAYNSYISDIDIDDYIKTEQSVDKSKCVVGDTLHYTIKVTNINDLDIMMYLVRLNIPDGLEYVKGTTFLNGESYASEITGMYGVIKGTTTKDTTDVIEFDMIATKEGEHVNKAFIQAMYKPEGQASFIVGRILTFDTKADSEIIPEVEIIKKVNWGDLRQDEVYTFTLSVTNTGNVDLKDIVVSDILDNHFSFQEASIKIDNESYIGIPTYISLESLLIDERKTITFDVKCTKVGSNIKNKSTLQGSYIHENDSGDVAGESNELLMNIREKIEAKVEVTKKSDKEKYEQNSIAIFNIAIKNTGNILLEDVAIKEKLDTHFKFIENSIKIDEKAYEGDLSSDISIGQIDENVTKTVTFEAEAITIGKDIKNSVTANCVYKTKEGEELLTNNSNEISVDILEKISPELTIVEKSNKNEYTIDDIAIFTTTVENSGNDDLKNLSFSQNLNKNFEFVQDSITINNVPYTGDLDNKVEVGNLDKTKSVTICFKAKCIKEQEDIPEQCEINAEYFDYEGEVNNIQKDGNELSIDIYNANFEGGKAVDSNTLRLNEKYTFTIVLKNTGDITINALTLIDDLDEEHFEFIENSIKIDDVPYERQLADTIEIPNLFVNTPVKVTFEVKCIAVGDAVNDAEIVATYKDKNEEDVEIIRRTNLLEMDIKEEENASYNIVKSIDENDLRLNEKHKITLKLQNNGNIDFNSIKLIDVLDDHFEFVENSIQIDDEVYDGTPEEINVAGLNVEETKNITFDVICTTIGDGIKNKVNSIGKYTNSHGTVSQVEIESNEISVNILKPLTPELEIIKSIDKNNTKLNTTRTFTIIVKNIGNVEVEECKIKDELNEHFEFVKNSIKIDNVQYEGTLDLIDIGSLDINKSKTLTFEAKAIKEGTNITNTADFTGVYVNKQSERVNVNKSSNTIYTNIYEKINTDIIFTKEVNTNLVKVGDQIDFIIKFKNNSNISVDHVRVVDNLDELFEYVENSTKIDGKISGNVVEGIDFGTINVNEEHRIDFKVKATTAYKDIKNSAIMAAYYEDEEGKPKTLNPFTNEVSVTVVNEIEFNGTVIKSTPKDLYYYNEIIPLEIKLTNTGTVEYDSIMINDNLNEALEFIEGSIKIDGVKSQGNVIDGIAIDNLLPGKTKTITFNVEPKKKNISVENIATAKISYYINENKSATLTSNTLNIVVKDNYVADLEIEKSSAYTHLSVGEITTIKLQLTNTGTTQLSNIKVYDDLPLGLDFIDGSVKVDYVKVDGNINNGIVIEDMKENYVTIVTFDVKATMILDEVKNRAYGTYMYNDLENNKLNSTSYSNELIFSILNDINPDINLIKTSDKISYMLGQTALFKLVVQNTGSIDVLNVTVTDNLPEEYKFVEGSLKVNAIEKTGSIIDGVNVGTLEKKEEVHIEFKALCNSAKLDISNKFKTKYEYENGTKLVENVVESQEYLTSIYEEQEAILEVKKEVDLNEVSINDYLKFSITLKNNGTKKVQNVKLIDKLDDSIKFIEGSLTINDKQSDLNISDDIDISDINIKDEVIITFKALAISKGTVINTANVEYEYETQSGVVKKSILSNEVIVEILENESSLILTKNANFKDTFHKDTNMFTITLTNTSKKEATNILIKDDIDTAYEYIYDSLTQDNIPVDGDITTGLNIEKISPSQEIKISFEVIGGVLKNNIYNVASAIYMADDSKTKTVYSNNFLTNIVDKKYAKIEIEKEEELNTINVNAENTVTLTIKNTGNVLAHDVFVTDKLDSSYKEVEESITVNKNRVGGSIQTGINIGVIEAGASKVVVFKELAITAKSDIKNIATAKYGYLDHNDNEKNDIVSSNVSVTNIVDDLTAKLSITKTALKSSLLLNEQNTFYIDVENVGNTKAKDIEIVDKLPENYQLVDDYILYNGKELIGNIISGIKLDDLDVNQSAKIEFKVKAIKEGQDIVNNSYINYKYVNGNNVEISNKDYSNNCLTNISKKDEAKLNIEKSVIPQNTFVDTIVTYDIKIRNIGNVKAESIRLIDHLPESIKFMDGSLKINGHTTTKSATEDIYIDDLGPSEESIISYECKALIKEDAIINMAKAIYCFKYEDEYAQKNSDSNECKLTVMEEEKGEILVYQEVQKQNIALYDVNTFKFSFVNNSNVDVYDIKLKDYLTDEYKLIKDSIKIVSTLRGENEELNNTEDINIGELPKNSTKELTFSATGILPGSNILNVGKGEYKYENNLQEEKTVEFDSNEVITNILEEKSPNIVITEIVPTLSQVGDPITVKINIKNTGDQTANNILIKDIIDDALDFVEGSLKIDNVVSKESILNEIIIESILPNESIDISFELMPRTSKVGANITTDVSYSYEDINNINRNKNTTSNSITDILEQTGPDISILKDANSLNYVINDTATFRIIITNNSQIDISNCILTDILDESYSFIEGTLRLNENKIEGDIKAGVNIGTIKKRSISVITFDAIAKNIAKNIENKATIKYSYKIGDKEKEKVLTSNVCITNIVDEPKVIIKTNKSAKIFKIEKGKINTFSITIQNIGNVVLENIVISDILDENYQFLEGSVSVNDIETEFDLNNIFIGNLEIGKNVKIKFNALALNIAKDIENFATINYEYIDIAEDIIEGFKDTNIIKTSIINEITKETIDLLNNIAKEEDVIGDIVDKEKQKLKVVIEKGENFEELLKINDSITDMIKTLSKKEKIAYMKLNDILENL